MTTAILVMIALMWLPVALLNLGKGEAKGTGAVTGIVGALRIGQLQNPLELGPF